MKSPYCGEEMIRMCTLIFWMMTEGKMQSFLKKHFKKKSCSICEYEQDFSIYNDIFYNISFDYPENFSL